MRRFGPFLCVLWLFGCVDNSLLPESDRIALEDDLASHARYLKVAMHVAPLFQDDGKWLLSDRSLDEVDLIDGTDGQPVNPGTPVGILPPGIRLRIDRVEFPTAFVIAERPIYTPRFNPWVYLVPTEGAGPVATLAHGKPFILVLRPQLKSRAEVLAEIDRYLSADNISALVRGLPPQIQEAIAQKSLITGMTPDQVQMSWGYPERIHIDEAQKTQVWSWPLGKQQAFFNSAGLTRWVDHGNSMGANPAGVSPAGVSTSNALPGTAPLPPAPVSEAPTLPPAAQ